MKRFKNNVGADASVRPTSKARQNKGITLIALVITIIAMLILVAVTISMAVNGGLFEYAGKAAGETQNAINVEQQLANGEINVGGIWYDSIDDYMKGIPSTGVKISLNITGEKVTTVPIPEGFKYKEGTIDTGYVIENEIDGNQFVWVPVDKNQKLTLEIESKEDIKEVTLKDPYGEIKLELTDEEIEKTYSNKEIPPTINGIYTVTVKTEENTVKKTLRVRSLYAMDAWNEYYTSEEGIASVSKVFLGESTDKEQFCEALAIQYYGSLENAMQITKSDTLDEFIYCLAATYLKQITDFADYSSYVNKSGGFYIARYEAGATTQRTTASKNIGSAVTVDEIITENGIPVSKEGYVPYNQLTRDQSLDLAESMYTSENFTVTLITNAAWDRTVGWVYQTGRKSMREIAFDSSSWGNYQDAEFEITKGKYSEDNGSSFTAVSEKYNKVKDKSVLLTTGSTIRNSVNNIFDLAGNVEEHTNGTYIESDGFDNFLRGRIL